MGNSLTAEHRTLNPLVLVQIQLPHNSSKGDKMLKLDDSVLVQKLDNIEALIRKLLNERDNSNNVLNWKPVFSVPFSLYPLGNLPEAWQSDIDWVGSNQAGALTYIDAFQNDIVLKTKLTNAYHNAQGARAFFLPDSPRWDFTVPYLGKKMRITYQQFLPKNLLLEEGDELWLSAGLEIKDDPNGNASFATNLVTENGVTFFTLQHKKEQYKDLNSKAVPINNWFNVEIVLDVDNSDHAVIEFKTGYGSYIKYQGQIINTDGGAGIALCLYGNNVIGGTAETYFRNFVVEVTQ